MELSTRRVLHVQVARYESEEIAASLSATLEEVAALMGKGPHDLPPTPEEALTHLREYLDAFLDGDIARLQEIAPSKSFIHDI